MSGLARTCVFTPVLAKHSTNFSIVGSLAVGVDRIQRNFDVPRHLARDVHKNYFEPTHPEFTPRTMWSLSNAFTSALKSLDPIPFFRATAQLGTFLHKNN